ncbi:zeta toxin family protein (plasmid) [Burkholderia multivorans]|uniref:zeta toxin family protein n=3 Tax=Burkholderia multivorans TaxID=87883 RepID=UPI001B9E9245|nr:zeta toxin family protein [Burkholderia multivorans]ELK7722780.1 zeta toxin family protein [Burkholderia cenocepacia]MBR8048082.1 zeta toxin family protein [Burkholderia multivorans]MBR8453215.1 zeta toxin family protein [Burkholderia multivorans]MBU9450146.1 zeta toxin family protein [Burkholderia multivorans]MCA8225688.1 zeta toxin family protein [Burkholderia multivorans]
MKLEDIRYVNFEEPDRRRVQDNAIEAVKKDPGKFFDAYKADARSFEGRYVAADLFKETFPDFSASREARNRYNNPVHNSAAVLSSALFTENLAGPRVSGRDTVYFLTGSPGAGKTSMVLKSGELPRDAVMVFEGQMSNFETSRAKIQQVLDAGYRAHIIVVHARVENALDNTLQRFYEEGRGSSIATIANIVGRLPESLEQLNSVFGPNLLLDVVDVRDRANPVQLQGFENIEVLKSEGNYEHIQRRLQQRVEDQREFGRIDEDAYRQALGLAPRDRVGLDRAGHDWDQGNARERAGAERSGGQTLLTAPPSRSHITHVPPGLRITESTSLGPDVVVQGKVIDVSDKQVLVQTSRTDAVRFSKDELSGNVYQGQNVQLNFQPNELARTTERAKEIKQPGVNEKARGIADT